jgi:hypothetical protein
VSYKDLLVVLDSEATARKRIAFAAALAERFSAHLVGLYSLPTPEAPRHFGYYDPALLDPFFTELREKSHSTAVKMREAFDHATGLRGLSAEWREIPEGPDADPALHARYADLAILGQLDPDRTETELIRPRPEQVALASGRPVLIVPYAGHFDNVGRRVLVAWNATREAARAVSDAMPLLTSAELVTVLTIDPSEGPHAHGELPGADIALHLARPRRQGANRANGVRRSAGGGGAAVACRRPWRRFDRYGCLRSFPHARNAAGRRDAFGAAQHDGARFDVALSRPNDRQRYR